MREGRVRVVSIAIAFLAIAGSSGVASAERRTMVVHLPDAPIESMSRLGEGVNQLAAYLQSAVPDLSLDVKAFRKSEDALSFLETQKDSVALVVCNAGFLFDLSDDLEVDHRFVRAGKETQRKIVVVKSESGISSLADLKGRSLTVALASTPGGARFLSENVFRNEIDPVQWFSTIAHETDDTTAVAAVLYAHTDSALVSEDNPLVKTHLGKELAQVYASAAVSLPVVAVRPQAFAPGQLDALERSLDALASRPDAEAIRTILAIDGFRRVEARRVADFFGIAGTRRELEVAIPGPIRVEPSTLAPLAPNLVPFVVGVELGEVTIPQDLVDSVLEGKPPAPKKSDREP